MKTLRITFIIIISLFTLSVSAATGKIKYLRTEHNVMHDGVKCMCLHFKVNTYGMKGRTAKVTIYVEHPKGVGVPDKNGSYCTSNGKVSASGTGKSTYENSEWKDFTVIIPNDEIHPLSGKRTYYIEALLRDGNKVLARTYCDTFTMTGTSASQEQSAYRQNNDRQGNSGQVQAKTWREDLGYGGFVIAQQFPNGFITRTRYRLCPNCRGSMACGGCNGTARCGICQGAGGIVTAGYGNWIPCSLCGQSGRCSLCGGSGKCFCAKGDYPGYAIGSTSTIAPDGTTTRNSADYNGHDYSNGSNSRGSGRSGKQTCPDCGGTRLWQGGKSPEYARPHSQLVDHYNSSGTKCPHCGYYNEHWHSKCATCKHYSGTDNPYR